MSKRTKWIIGITSLVALLAIIAPIYYYVNDFHKLDRSPVSSDWGTFGDFFGGILNPIISFLTLVVTIVIAVNIGRIEKRNHDESVHSPVKPLFTIESGDFFHLIGRTMVIRLKRISMIIPFPNKSQVRMSIYLKDFT